VGKLVACLTLSLGLLKMRETELPFHLQPLTAADAETSEVLMRALAAFSEDIGGDRRAIVSALASGGHNACVLADAAGVQHGVAVWYDEDGSGRYAAVQVLHVNSDAPAGAADALIAHVWDTLTESPVLEMISVRVYGESPAVRAGLARRGAVVFIRHLMVCDLVAWQKSDSWQPPEAAAPEGYTLAHWEPEHQAEAEAAAVLVQSGGVDAVVIPDALPDRIAQSLRQVRAGTYPEIGPCIEPATIVALDAAGHVAGYIATVDMGLLAFVADIGVHPAHRRRGLARMLVVEAMRRVRDHGYPMISLAVTARNPAVRLYEQIGFEIVNSGKTAIWWRDGRQLAWQMPEDHRDSL
jgi:ribosomal protein S18 acetylase RimI-like enzyme